MTNVGFTPLGARNIEFIPLTYALSTNVRRVWATIKEKRSLCISRKIYRCYSMNMYLNIGISHIYIKIIPMRKNES